MVCSIQYGANTALNNFNATFITCLERCSRSIQLCVTLPIRSFFSSRVSNSQESNNSQLFSMETNKKKFYFLYKTFSGISLVQFMVRPRNSNKSVKFGISRNVFLGGFFQNFPDEIKNSKIRKASKACDIK